MSSSVSPPVGRFAPSPTGPLHFGSLVTALASYLDARQLGGRWLVRMEDLDPPREQPGAADAILRTLEALGLEWDGPVRYQSRCLAAYQAQLDRLRDMERAYPCDCSRRSLRQRTAAIYDGHCRYRPDSPQLPCAWRFAVRSTETALQDLIQDLQNRSLEPGTDDFVIKRRDGLFAYQLAVVVDDADQGITRVVRGQDLLEATPWQQALQDALAMPRLEYAHVPLVLNAQGQKLSKQNQAAPLESSQPGLLLWRALSCLGQRPPAELKNASRDEVLQWGLTNWRLSEVPTHLDY